jgi:two-component system, cell cycle response regulator
LINVERTVVAPEESAEASLDADESGAYAFTTPTSILLVEDEGLVARDLEETLTRLGYDVSGVASEGAEAIAMAQALHPQLVLMDVNLRGGVDGIQAARAIQELSPVPIIFLTGHSDTRTLQRAVLTGPLAYLIKPFHEVELRCAIEVAIHKHRAEVAMREREEALRRSAEQMQNLSLIDELTQLRNRRGFFELAQQALKTAKREQYPLALFFMDLNGLKQINDRLGHVTGDQALRDAARVLRRTFRASDIVARIGGDEFVALAHMHATADTEALCARLREQLAEFNLSSGQRYTLDISIGTTIIDTQAEENLEELLARADAAMYEEKRRPR